MHSKNTHMLEPHGLFCHTLSERDIFHMLSRTCGGTKLDMKHTDTSSHVLALVLPAFNTATLALHDGESAAQTKK